MATEVAPDPHSVESIRGITYLFQEEQSSSHVGRYLLLAVLGIAAAFAGWRWRDLRSFTDKISTSVQANPAESSAAPPASPPSSPASPAHTPAEPQPAANPPAQAQMPPAAPPEDSTEEASVQNPPVRSQKARIEPASRRSPVPDTSELEGEKYLYGEGVPQDCGRAQKDLLAAAKHSAKAQTDLAAMYATGHCAFRDLPLAYRWFGRAERQSPHGDKKIAENMRVLWNQMTPEERKLASR